MQKSEWSSLKNEKGVKKKITLKKNVADSAKKCKAYLPSL